jgi:hypothetical protein
MRQILPVFFLLVICLTIAGCTNTNVNERIKTMNETQTPNLYYSNGDVLIEYTGDLIGYIVLDNSDANSYLVSPIIMDINGTTYFLGDQILERVDRHTFENKYSIQAGHIQDPYWMERMIQKFKEKFESGDIITETNTSVNGLLIARYDYSQDEYTVVNAQKTNGEWKFNSTARETGDRTTIETKYKEKIAKIVL